MYLSTTLIHKEQRKDTPKLSQTIVLVISFSEVDSARHNCRVPGNFRDYIL